MLATTASATAAARLHRILKEQGIFSEMARTPASLSAAGCSYSLRFSSQEDLPSILRLAARHGIKLRAVWKETNDADAPYQKVYG